MQTFFPFSSIGQSARVLDYRRLGKQRVESRQIIDTLEGNSKGWRNHPAVRMWDGYTDGLKHYFNVMSHEWIRRGYKHTMGFYVVQSPILPPWVGVERFHSSHRAALLWKLPAWYNQFQWSETPEYNYYWPSNERS